MTLPGPVVGGTVLNAFAFIGAMGIDMLRQTDLRLRSGTFLLAGALTMGLLPILVPGLYSRFPANVQLLLGHGVAIDSFTAVVLNLLFNHIGTRKFVEHGEVAPLSLPSAAADQRVRTSDTR